jgi:hypothetical protein
MPNPKVQHCPIPCPEPSLRAVLSTAQVHVGEDARGESEDPPRGRKCDRKEAREILLLLCLLWQTIHLPRQRPRAGAFGGRGRGAGGGGSGTDAWRLFPAMMDHIGMHLHAFTPSVVSLHSSLSFLTHSPSFSLSLALVFRPSLYMPVWQHHLRSHGSLLQAHMASITSQRDAGRAVGHAVASAPAPASHVGWSEEGSSSEVGAAPGR